jgi:hypothetical protein
MKMKLGKNVFTLLVFLLLSLISAPVSAEQYKQIVVATGSPFELGLVDEMARVFFKETG